MRNFFLSAWVCVGFATPLFAATHKVPPEEPIASIRIPDKWQAKEYGERVEADSPDRAVYLLVMPVERNKTAESMGEAMRYIRNRGGITVKSNTIRNEPGKLNGMDARFVSWQARDKNGDVEIKFVILSLAENQQLLAVYWGSPGANKKYRSELDKMLQSITKS
jgi:hypothetical protein